MPGFHSLTGCDSNSAFYGVGKKRAWSVWQEFPEATNAPMHISTTPEEVHARIMAVLEELVVRMYSSSLSAITSVNKARFEMFHYGGKDFDHIPPTQDAWSQALIQSPAMPSPSLWGYKLKNACWEPEWITLPTIKKKHLHICHCKKVCKPPCVCVVNNACCTSPCTCRGNCYPESGYPKN